MIEKKKLIIIALMHNNDVKRNTYIRPLLEKLQAFISGQFNIKLIESTYKPKVKPHSRSMGFLRDIIYQKLNREWLRYRLLKPPLLLRHISWFLWFALKTRRYVGGKKCKWLQTSAIEMVVTDMHIRAWEAFLDMNGDFLICFEDDVVFKEDSIQRVRDLINFLYLNNKNHPIYIDLAGGCQHDDLKIDKLESHRDSSFRYYSKPVTNTACGYLLNRPLVTHFQDTLIRRPWLRLIGVDWMINNILILLNKSGMHCDCMHSEPTIFEHGSMTHKYLSMSPIRQ